MTKDIKWTKSTRAKLHGFRTSDKHDPKDDDSWLVMCIEQADGEERDADVRVAGAAKDIIAGLSEQMAIDSDAPDSLDFDPIHELHRAALFSFDIDGSYLADRFRWADARALTRFWIKHGGLAGFFEVISHPAVFERQVYNQSTKVGKRWVDKLTVSITDLVDVPSPMKGEPDGPDNPFQLSHNVYSPFVWGLCCWASELDDDEFASAVKAIRKVRKALPDDAWVLRFATSFAFRRDPSLGDEDLARYMKADEAPSYWPDLEMLVASLSSAEDAHELLRLVPKIQPAVCAFDWVEAYGKDAVPLLEEKLAQKGAPGWNGKSLKAAIKLASK